MGREVRRVPLDFEHPLGEVWPGFLRPYRFAEDDCPDCENGYSPYAQHLFDLWYGKVPFDPVAAGFEPLTQATDVVQAFAERNVAAAPEYYGTGPFAVSREARRLAELFNSRGMHHLAQEDVDALVAANRLWDFTRKFVPGEGWKDLDPPVVPTAAQVNEWSIQTMGHDAINAGVVIRARCERAGTEATCTTCDGHGSTERYPGQRAEAEAWEPTDPPAGDGWQLWETVSEGSPVSPVFPDAEALAAWLTTEEGGEASGPSGRPMALEQARAFVDAGWAPTMVGDADGLHDGAAYVGAQKVLDGVSETGQDDAR